MAISSVAIRSFEQVQTQQVNVQPKNVKSEAQEAKPQANGVVKNEQGVEVSGRESRRKELNASILQSHVNLSSQNEPIGLLYKSALEAINKELEPTLGKNAAQKAFADGTDFSPEATSARIVNFATSFFPLYQQQHKGEGTLADQLDKFLDVVGGGVEKGFGEAKDILKGLDVFNGEIEENANKTYDLIYEGFSKFRDSVLEANGQGTQSATQQTEDTLSVKKGQ